MSIQFDQAQTTPADQPQPLEEQGFGDWDLDITIVECGPAADRLIYMTDDNCGQTCQSACSGTCPV